MSDEMGVYFKCLCGDSEHLGLMEPDAVAVRDPAGRTWICYPIDAGEAESHPQEGLGAGAGAAQLADQNPPVIPEHERPPWQ